jgi:hypothetical protein
MEKAFQEMIGKVKAASLIMEMLDLLYKTYHYSAKSRRELKVVGKELGVSVKIATRVKGIIDDGLYISIKLLLSDCE